MEKQLKIVYYYNSGFSVQVGSTLFIFDYWEGENRSLSASVRIRPELLKAYERIYVFISHAHPDHLDPVVYTWAKEGLPITYIVSSDMPIGTIGKRLAPLQEKQLTQDIWVKAYQSTDLGVAFLVEAYGLRIFHAGDLNLWHWRQESTLREIEAAEKDFYDALEPLKGEHIDVAMFPVDPRQGLMYDAGANHFILTEKPRVFIPMHWQDRPEVAIDFARSNIRCNAICPGGVETEIGGSMMSGSGINQFGMGRAMAGLDKEIRTGKPEELAAAVLFVASDEASFLNGVNLPIDGGVTCY